MVISWSDGWQETVAERATDYVTETTWNRLFPGRRRKHCKALAKIAAAILAGKEKTHDIVRFTVGGFLSLAGADKSAQAFAGELASKIPLPTDVKFIAVARAVQVTGVLLCVANGDDLMRCQCFIDLALAEAKTRVRKILVAAMNDWVGLRQFPPSQAFRPLA